MLTRFLTEAEYKRLLDACAHNPRDFALIQQLLQTGIKLSELTRLTIKDMDLPSVLSAEKKEKAYLHILGIERQKERIIPLNYKACLALDGYLQRRKQKSSSALFLNRFGKGLSPRGVEKIVSKYFEQIDLEDTNVQSLRHTFGTHHAVKGTNLKTLQTAMGHKDARSTSLYLTLANELMLYEVQENSL